MSDLLSASSLLMAISAILFSLWYADISKALETEPKNYSEDNVAAKKTVTAILLSKALPVAIMALAVALIFLPDAIKITRESFLIYASIDHAPAQYDAVRTAYCFVTILSVVLSIYMWRLVFKLISLRKRLS
ncbi:hypothetical protein [Achromobacter ruhlandii]|uniref:hypothetical protein n=1 Tax=Achromobacter ruhlandii TaxID=72557 RepID=UPI00158335F9|nr:hypothetical protein [Achromobacter ruhlandii]